MNIDSYFEIGSSHKVCQDYALHGRVMDWSYVIGCDGCSSSPMTDVGARLLAFKAKSTIKFLRSLHGNHLINPTETEVLVRKTLFLGIRNICMDFQISAGVMDATLLIIISDEQNTLVMGWGDGSIILNYPEQEPLVISRHYQSGAPYYLSHGIDQNRTQSYIEQFNQPVVTLQDSEEISESPPTEPFIYKVPDPNWVSISICSDGIDTYRNEQNDFIPVGGMAKRWVAYKNPIGEFVQRRMQALKRECLKEGLRHTDDIFCGSIIR